MSWAGKQHPVEVAIELLAPIPLALAVGWASWRVGLPSAGSVLLGLAAMAGGLAVFKFGSGAPPVAVYGFEPAELAPVELDELLLEAQDSVLDLSDRLDELCPDSRVVRLFERIEPTPGELVDRIVDFLADGRRDGPPARPAAGDRQSPDASAALHDALANIRASLR